MSASDASSRANPATATTTASRRHAVVVLVATLVGMGVTARLGVWQLSRAAQKEAMQQALIARTEADAAAQHYRRTTLHGEWVAAATVFLDNRQMNGRPGFYVVTPLKL